METYPGNFPPHNPEAVIRTLSSEEAAAYWTPEAVAERESNAPQSRE